MIRFSIVITCSSPHKQMGETKVVRRYEVVTVKTITVKNPTCDQ